MVSTSEEQPIPGLPGPPAPGKLVGRGHPAGDLLEAYEWDVLEQRDGCLRVMAHLPPALRNYKGQLFGGFTATYVDFVALYTFWAGRDRPQPGRGFLSTLSLRVEYFAPVVTDRFELSSIVVNRGGSTCAIQTDFLDPEGERLVYAYTTLRAATGAL